MTPAAERLGAFAIDAAPPQAARARAAAALLDTAGVTLAGASEPASRAVQQVVAAEGGDGCHVFGTAARASATGAALANGTAAHALDFDDMCFVSLAHPSAPLVAAALAAGMRGRKQDSMFAGGNRHLDTNYPKLDRLVRARVVEEKP